MTLRKLAIVMICCLCLLCFIGCKQDTADTDFTNKQTINMDGETTMMTINDTADGIILDDLLESIEMLGKTATEIGIPREVINTEKSYYIKTYIDGYIFGTHSTERFCRFVQRRYCGASTCRIRYGDRRSALRLKHCMK
jgi:hypothetical protein